MTIRSKVVTPEYRSGWDVIWGDGANDMQLRPGWTRQDNVVINHSINGRVWSDDGTTWSWSFLADEQHEGHGSGCASAWRAMATCEREAGRIMTPQAVGRVARLAGEA